MEAIPEASFEAALAAALTAVEAPTEQQVAPAPDAQVQPAPAAPAPVAAAPAAASDPAPVPKYLLDREAAIEAREKSVRETESRARAAEERMRTIESREATLAKQAAAFDADPVGYVRQLRPDLSPTQAAAVAEKFYHVALGDRAPVEARLQQEVAEAKRYTAEATEGLRTEIDKLQWQAAEAQRQALIAQYQASLRKVGTELKAAEYPILANLASRDPDTLTQELFNEAVQAARESIERGDSKAVELTPAEAATRAEARLKAQRDRLYGPATAPAAPAPQTPQVELTNRTASVQPSRTAPDELDDRALRKLALEKAGLGHVAVWD